MSSNRKSKKMAATASGAAPVLSPPGSLWPGEFVPFRKAMLALFCIAGWGLILAMLAAGNNLLGLKQALMIIAGARMEPMLLLESLHSRDIAAVLFGFVLVLGAGYIHVSLGVAALLALRPWIDGYTYPADNTYFVWAAMILMGIWGLRCVAKPRAVRAGISLGLFALFLGCTALSAFLGHQQDSAYQQLVWWFYYGAVYFLAIHAAESRASRAVILTGLLVGVAGQAIYAYPYLAYLLPALRQQMARNPEYLAAHFSGIAEATPEIARRLNVNRASASMIYPNALAALLILGLPLCFTLALNSVNRLRTPLRDDAAPRITSFRFAIPWALALFSVAAIGTFVLGLFPFLAGVPWYRDQTTLAGLSVLVAAVITGAFLFTVRKTGLARAGVWVGSAALVLLFPIALAALWITYSRGAMLALAAACVSAWLVTGRRKPLLRLRKPVTVAVLGIALFLAGLHILAASPEAEAQAPGVPSGTVPAVPPSPGGLVDQGIDVSLRDMADPASFSLRLSYWRVALAMALDNWLTGVGPGNFKFAYPRYQYLGAGDVQNAHNGLLQAWCETGIVGALILLAFWLHLLWRGVMMIRQTADRALARLALGLTVGILAFLLHALLDMNLSHPTLMTFAMVSAGLLIGLHAPAAPAPVAATRAVPVLLLLAAALVSGIALRPYLQFLGMGGGKYLHVDDQDMIKRRLRTASFFLVTGPAWANSDRQKAPPELPVRDVISLLVDRAQLFELGHVLLRNPRSGETVPVPADAGIPPDALFQIVRPWDAHAAVFDLTEQWIRELERLDARWPHSPELALHIASGYKLLTEQAAAKQRDRRADLMDRMLHWAEVAVQRNPYRGDLYQMLAWVHWTCGAFSTGQESLGHYNAALKAFERGTERAPNEASFHLAYSQALKAIGDSYTKAGNPAQGDRLTAQAAAEAETVLRIQRERGARGLD